MNHQGHKGHQDGIAVGPRQEVDDIARAIVDSAYNIHKEIGPGLLENAYEAFLVEELSGRGLSVQTQVPLKTTYKNKTVDMAYRLDLVVNEKVLIELKSCEKLLPIHQAQILTYLKLSKMKLGLLINFNVPLIKDGIKRFAL